MADLLAPIILFTYNRPVHTEKTLNSLAENPLAKDSDLYIFCDGPKNEKAVKGNEEVKKIINSEKGKNRFKSVNITISEKNKGLAKSVIGGVSEVIKKYGRCIVVEDDLVLSPYFLNYMNDCLVKFKDDKRIWSISAFTYPLKALRDYKYDIYLSYRACSQGWGIWADRWEKVDWQVKDFISLKWNIFKRMRFNRGGNDLYRMLRHQMRGERDSWAIRFCYSQFNEGMMCVYPKTSLLYNIGNDGSGTHCEDKGEDTDNMVLAEVTKVDLNYEEKNKKILRQFKAMYRVTFAEAVDWLLKKLKIKKTA